ncbi:dTDP-glucose 4,6-dehydratase [Roseobacter sp. HKCCA0434]|uniref:dTDP-glucose 4,6-dehydratase n=1 Tax=Roseobacter sp. HKCCA0434 TaxID=3079297 RepID=UPI002905D56C|nr:dTDP-glucose 4,6-dehydratase [Roseobacter sp. HKCCA0434]
MSAPDTEVDRILVTGGAGFIGSAVVRHLVGEGHEVTTFDALTYAGNLASLRAVADAPNHRFVKGDIRDAAALETAFADARPTRVLHLAAESHVDRSIDGPDDFITTNVLGTLRVLEAARARRDAGHEIRVLHVSTDEVYGSLGEEGLFTEDTPYDPSSPYSASKAGSDHLARAWARTYGLDVVTSNCSNNYGPYHYPEKLIPLTILNALEGRPLPIYGDGSNVRDWLHVEDHARALDLISARGQAGRTYNVGGRNERTNLQVVRAICAALDRHRPDAAPHDRLITFVTDRPGHDARYAIDATRLEDELGWRAVHDFDSGIEATVAWYLDNDWWWGPLRDAAAERRGLKAEARG